MIIYSQQCEDMVFENIWYGKLNGPAGFYVDVGAHHPIIYSNTYRLWLNGWRGINIDPLPGSMDIFEEFRPDDININVGVGSENSTQKYYSFEAAAYNTFGSERAEEVISGQYTRLKEEVDIPVYRLDYIFEQYLGNNEIDLLNIDVETKEMDVLLSNDWDRFRPKFVIAEALDQDCESIFALKDCEVVEFLMEADYEPISKVGSAVFFADQRS